MKLLIVENNAAVRQVIRSIVANPADEVHECIDGMDALAAYIANRPDFVLMDIEMNGLDGITATRRIKAAHPAAKIIIVTNYDDPALREAARNAGACGYVLKENLFEVSSLLKTLIGSDDGREREI
jgi:CheY-like chemotaxis protein